MKIRAVIETAIYVDNLQAAEDFYHDLLGLPILARETGRHVFFQVGTGDVLLTFLAESTLISDTLPPHGAKGPGHLALGIDIDTLEDWRNFLKQHAIAIEKEILWPRGGKSLYFRDPAGNSVELITPGVWGLPSGW